MILATVFDQTEQSHLTSGGLQIVLTYLHFGNFVYPCDRLVPCPHVSYASIVWTLSIVLYMEDKKYRNVSETDPVSETLWSFVFYIQDEG
jgi:hypothetical protein